MIYISANKETQKEIKNICKKYNDLSPDIVRKIIDYKMNKKKNTDYVFIIRGYNEKIYNYKRAIDEYMKMPVLNRYSKVPIDEAMKRLDFLLKSKKEVIQEARYEHFGKMNKIDSCIKQ